MLKAVSAAILACLFATSAAHAHPAPFTYLDLRLDGQRLDVSLVAHIFDVAHDLPIDPPERLLAGGFLEANGDAIRALLGPRLIVRAGGQPLPAVAYSAVEAIAEQQSVRMRMRYAVPEEAGSIQIGARLFPYDPAHQSFVNVYEGGQLTLQALLDAGKPDLEYFRGSRQGRLALATRFVPAGMRHMSFGLEHLLFLVGIVLLGGSRRTFLAIGTALLVGNLASYLLTSFDLLRPPERIIEPAIALAIIYVGTDNLMVRGGRDVRPWIAGVFGLIHAFWFANGLRISDLPPRTLSWSLLCFDVGVQIVQLSALTALAAAITVLYRRYPSAIRTVASIGSVGVIAGGVYWFVQRVFLPTGI